MSKMAPIKLLHSFYPNIEFIANSNFGESEEPQDLEPVVSTEVQMHSDDNASTSFIVGLFIELTWPNLDRAPYSKARINHLGVFALSPSLKPDVAEKHKCISAPSMLYSAAREFVRILTSQGPWDPIFLPAVQFSYDMALLGGAEEASTDEVESR